MNERANRIGKALAGVLLALGALWQAALAIQVARVASLFDQSSVKPVDLGAMFVVFSQPFMWVLVATTVVLAFDIMRREKFLLLNTVAVVLAVALGTAFLHMLVVVGGYGYVAQLGSGK